MHYCPTEFSNTLTKCYPCIILYTPCREKKPVRNISSQPREWKKNKKKHNAILINVKTMTARSIFVHCATRLGRTRNKTEETTKRYHFPTPRRHTHAYTHEQNLSRAALTGRKRVNTWRPRNVYPSPGSCVAASFFPSYLLLFRPWRTSFRVDVTPTAWAAFSESAFFAFSRIFRARA